MQVGEFHMKVVDKEVDKEFNGKDRRVKEKKQWCRRNGESDQS